MPKLCPTCSQPLPAGPARTYCRIACRPSYYAPPLPSGAAGDAIPAKGSTSYVERLLSRFEPTDAGCWAWLGTLTRGGYGQIARKGRNVVAHRAMWEHFRGPIPDGLVLDHLCGNRACVNPDHLEPVSYAENNARARSTAA